MPVFYENRDAAGIGARDGGLRCMRCFQSYIPVGVFVIRSISAGESFGKEGGLFFLTDKPGNDPHAFLELSLRNQVSNGLPVRGSIGWTGNYKLDISFDMLHSLYYHVLSFSSR